MGEENPELKRVVEDLKKDFDRYKEETNKRFSIIDKIIEELKKGIEILKETALRHSIAIEGIQKSLGEIQGDTKWLRRTITASLITVAVGAIIAALTFVPK